MVSSLSDAQRSAAPPSGPGDGAPEKRTSRV